MGLKNKINEIRRKPEHIRVRYAWFCAIGVTLMVIIIWIFSLFSQRNEITSKEIFTPDQVQSFQDLNSQKNSLEDATKKIQSSLQSTPDQTMQNDQSGNPYLNPSDQSTQPDQNASPD